MFPEHKDDFCYLHTKELLTNFENIYVYHTSSNNITT